MGGVVSIRECQKALQDAQAREGIRTDVDRKTVLRAAALLADAGRIAVWRVPADMETGFVNTGKTLFIQTEGAIAPRSFEEALARFSNRQEKLHASRLEIKTNTIESGRKRSQHSDSMGQLLDDSSCIESRQPKRKRFRYVIFERPITY
jgi:hypothetical protein